MTIGIIPTSKDHAHYSQVTQVDGRGYLFRFAWNGRRGRWTVSIYEADTESPILLGLTIVDGWPLGKRSRDPRLPAGVFMAYDPSGSGVDPGFSDMHAEGRTLLMFVPAADLASDDEETVETIVATPVP